MKAFIFSSALLALAVADTCSDCTAVVSTIAARLPSEESIAAQQVVFLLWRGIYNAGHSHGHCFISHALKHLVVSTIAAHPMSEESIATRQSTQFKFDLQGILVGGLCPGAEDPAECEAALPGLWAGIAALLWPGYWDPNVS